MLIRHLTYFIALAREQYRGSDKWEIAAGGSDSTDESFELAQAIPRAAATICGCA
jgi:hypothetical protein